MAAAIMTNTHRQRFKDAQEVDLAYSVPGLGRFRCNVFQQRGTIGMVLRVIPGHGAEHRGARPAAGAREDRAGRARADPRHRHHWQRQEHDAGRDARLHQQHAERRTSSRSRTRSSTCTATRKSIINQREIGVDTRSFASALRSALRQDPDVILVGEMRDQETIETALHAAETGHLVLLHAAHARRHRDHQPHHLGVSAAPAEADPSAARLGAQGRRSHSA